MSLSISTTGIRGSFGGIAIALFLIAGLGAIMFAFRGHLSDATVALVLVVPVVGGVVVGGVWAGIVAVAAGFLLYDLVFIPPYYTLTVASGHDLVALGVYVVVVSLLARVVHRLRIAEDEAKSREADAQRLFDLSELLIEDRPLSDLLPLVVSMLRDAFESESVVLLLPREGRLEVVAMSGRELTGAELHRVTPTPGMTASLTPSTTFPAEDSPATTDTETIVLSAPRRPVGMVGFVGTRMSPHRRALAAAFANHIAVAIERTQLQEEAMRMSVLEEVDRVRGALVGAVSHDLRTPLATIKASASTLLDTDTRIGPAEERELLGLIDEQADQLARLVTNLLDMGRIEAGSLVVDRQPLDVGELIEEAVAALRPHVSEGRIAVHLAESLPSIEADHVLVGQVLVNLLENALRYAPEGSVVEVSARAGEGSVEIAVTDRGPGFRAEDRVRLFGLGRPTGVTGTGDMTTPSSVPNTSWPPSGRAGSPAGGSGVGLAIAKAFVEAHGGRIWEETVGGGGARVGFSLPARTGK
jgi:two-component system, OmpR family, sensor histidine kinase KdpD